MRFKGTIIGRLGQDPEMRTTRKGDPMCVFSVAANRRYTNEDNEPVENTIWVSCSAYRRAAEVIHGNVKRGELIFVEGEVYTHEYVRQDGSPGYSIDLDVKDFNFLQPRADGSAGESVDANHEPETGWDPTDNEP